MSSGNWRPFCLNIPFSRRTPGMTDPATAAAAVSAAASAIGVSITAMESNYNVTCVISIANNTEWKLMSPQLEIHNGSVAEPPAVIEPKTTGVVACHKTAYSVMGCGITATWNLGNTGTQFSVNFGIAGGGWSWFNANHLELAIMEHGGVVDKNRQDFHSGKRNLSAKVSSKYLDIEGTMGNTDHAKIMVYISQKK